MVQSMEAKVMLKPKNTIPKPLRFWMRTNCAGVVVQVHGAHFARRSPIIRVLGHSHDLKRARMFQVIAEMFSNGPAIFEILFLEETIYQGHGTRRRRVLLINGSAFHNLGADGIEVTGTYPQPRCAMVRRSGRRRRVSFYIDTFAPVVTHHWAIKRKTYLLDARNCADILFKLPIERF